MNDAANDTTFTTFAAQLGPGTVARLTALYGPGDAFKLTNNVSLDFCGPFPEEPDEVLDLCERMACRKLTTEERDLAIQAACGVPMPSLKTLAAAWIAVPALKAFAESLATAAIPGHKREAGAVSLTLKPPEASELEGQSTGRASNQADTPTALTVNSVYGSSWPTPR